jgi:prepilin peptidase CpaA
MNYLLNLDNWPVLVICVGMLAAAVIDWWKFKVPNKLTFPLVISGWLLGLANNFGLEAGHGGIGAALAGTVLGLALLLPMYAIGGMGAGDVKMTMGFGSWIGAFYGLPQGLWIILYAFCAGAIIGGVIALGMIIARGNYRQNISHTREIFGDFGNSAGIAQIAEKANARRPRWHRLPYGVPLCIGFIGSLLYLQPPLAGSQDANPTTNVVAGSR